MWKRVLSEKETECDNWVFFEPEAEADEISSLLFEDTFRGTSEEAPAEEAPAEEVPAEGAPAEEAPAAEAPAEEAPFDKLPFDEAPVSS